METILHYDVEEEGGVTRLCHMVTCSVSNAGEH